MTVFVSCPHRAERRRLGRVPSAASNRPTRARAAAARPRAPAHVDRRARGATSFAVAARGSSPIAFVAALLVALLVPLAYLRFAGPPSDDSPAASSPARHEPTAIEAAVAAEFARIDKRLTIRSPAPDTVVVGDRVRVVGTCNSGLPTDAVRVNGVEVRKGPGPFEVEATLVSGQTSIDVEVADAEVGGTPIFVKKRVPVKRGG